MTIRIKKGLDLPLAGAPVQEVRPAGSVSHVALLGCDYPGLRPSMVVKEGDYVTLGQHLFNDRKNEGVKYTSPGCGKIVAVNRGPKRKFESIVICLDGEEIEEFAALGTRRPADLQEEEIKATLVDSGMWTSLISRPYGKVPALTSQPSSLFVAAIDTLPLAADPSIIISIYKDDFLLGLEILKRLVPKVFLCTGVGTDIPGADLSGISLQRFAGPHPAGLPSTHIHFLDPVSSSKMVWHIDYFDVIGIGYLFKNGHLLSDRIIALSGSAMKEPSLVKTRVGASIKELCVDKLQEENLRVLSGSVLTGHHAKDTYAYLGRYHKQVCAIPEGGGRGFLGWLRLGRDRYSFLPLFLSSLLAGKKFSIGTAAWGGHRAIFPLDVYDNVVPLDLIMVYLLKSLALADIGKSEQLGCLEIVEEDLALCSFVCPGKNDFGPMLRQVLNVLEKE